MKCLCLILLVILTCGKAYADSRVVVKLKNSASSAVADAVVYTISASNQQIGSISDASGIATFSLANGNYTIYVTHLSHMPLQKAVAINSDTTITLLVQSLNKEISEVVVTASESKRISSVSHIGRDAMSHLQPSSLTDLMEMLPGGVSEQSQLTRNNGMTLRETGNLNAQGQKSFSDNYATHSLGTLFVVDGAPINTDANMQSSPASATSTSDKARNTVNRGVDMRSISTDDIESVEIIRGIPSVEYGNLTSGVMNIRKVRKPTALTARLKADDRSLLMSVGKGIALGSASARVLNLNAGYTRAFADPRNPLDEFSRFNISGRYTAQMLWGNAEVSFTPAVDYAGSLDKTRTDPEINYGGIDTYRSSYNKVSASSGLTIVPAQGSLLKSLSVNAQLSQQFDKIERQMLVTPKGVQLAPSVFAEGEYDAHMQFREYVASYTVDGKPLTAFVKLMADLNAGSGMLTNSVKLGGEWNVAKNYGDGTVYDVLRPLPTIWSSRPRTFRSIPALHTLALFVQDYSVLRLGNQTFDVRLGARATTLPRLSCQYVMSGKFYIDPRANIQWASPMFGEHKWRLSVSGGVGQTTKMPTVDYLYPADNYVDILQLSYFDVNNPTELSRYNVVSYRQPAANYDLKPARNLKWEVRADVEVAGNRLWVCYFNENMSSGFRYTNVYNRFAYKDYDESAIPHKSLTSRPELAGLPYSNEWKLEEYRYVENGSRQDKQGVEFELTTKRVKALRSAVKLSGAWFRSRYANSRPMYRQSSVVVGNVAIADKYMGLYNVDENNTNEQFSTNLLLDTQVPEWGLIFSTSVQAVWFTQTERSSRDNVPTHYMSTDDGLLHVFTPDGVKENPLLQHLVLTSDNYRNYRVPVAAYLNAKISKRVGNMLSVSMYVNKLFDYMPDFTRNGTTIRRNATPYFGMEANIKL